MSLHFRIWLIWLQICEVVQLTCDVNVTWPEMFLALHLALETICQKHYMASNSIGLQAKFE